MYKKILFYFLILIGFISILHSATIINTLPYNITISGEYELDQNLNTTDNGILIASNNVDLDCKGFTLTGNRSTGQYGVYFNFSYNYTNVTNCNINNFNVGINTLNGYYGNFSNLNLFNNSGNGLSCGFDNSTYTNINSSFNGAIGLYFWAVMYSDISNLNSFSNTNEGIYFNSIYVVRANLINTYSNLGRGFRIYSSSDSNFSIINSYNNINDGIYMFSIFNCIFNNFNLTNNRYGMYVYDSNSNIFTNGSSYLNMNSNIFFRKVGSSPATNNTFYNNFLGNSSKITSDYTFDTSYKNYFNYSGIGNRWDDMPTCLSTTTVNGNIICTNPANYTINATLNIYDFAPFDYRYTEPIGAEQSNLNSIFPSLSLNSILFNLIILFGYFIFN